MAVEMDLKLVGWLVIWKVDESVFARADVTVILRSILIDIRIYDILSISYWL